MHPICSVGSSPRKQFWLLAAAHGLGLVAALLAAACLRLGWREGLIYLTGHPVTAAASWMIFLIAFGTAGAYDPDRTQGFARPLKLTALAVLGGMLIAASLLWAADSSRIAIDLWLTFAAGAFVAAVALRLALRSTRGSALMTSRCLVIGTNGEARRALELIQRHPEARLQVVGLVHCGTDAASVGTQIGKYPVLGTDATLERLIQLHRVDRLIVAAPSEVEAALLRRLRSTRYRGVALADYVSLHEELTQEIPVEHIDDEWLFAAAMNTSRPHIRRSKRILDVVTSVVGLVLTLPITALAALLIKLDSAGPVLFRQERMGRDGARFMILKFRTMTADAEARTGPVWALAADARITRAGRWLRKFRIDEVPQLINVLRGEMSVIGPRPEREFFVKQLEAEIPFYAERFMVHPGITGWAQVMQAYASSVEESRRKLQADLYYIKHMSFMTDLHIMMKTLTIVLSGHERSASREGAAAGHVPAVLEAHLSLPAAPRHGIAAALLMRPTPVLSDRSRSARAG